MRVIAGTARSLKLVAPEGLDTRPTTDRIKETLFNIIQNDVPGSVFVDLFAGSGGIGIEALSRGAKKAFFVDNSKEAIGCIEANLKHTKLNDMAVVYKQDAISSITYTFHEDIDVLFADPPYKKGFDQMILEACGRSEVVTKDTLIIIEEDVNTDFSYALDMGFDIIKEKIYKTNKHVFLMKK